MDVGFTDSVLEGSWAQLHQLRMHFSYPTHHIRASERWTVEFVGNELGLFASGSLNHVSTSCLPELELAASAVILL